MFTKKDLYFNEKYNSQPYSDAVVFIRTENAVGARSAQVHLSHATVFETLYDDI
jgi:hypothetical protein